MTGIEIANIAIATIGAVAAIIAARGTWIQMADRRRSEKAKTLSETQEALVFIASRSADQRIKVAPYATGPGLLVCPSLDGRCLILRDWEDLEILTVLDMLEPCGVTSMMHGPPPAPNVATYQSVKFYRLTLSGRERALQVPGNVASMAIRASGLDWAG